MYMVLILFPEKADAHFHVFGAVDLFGADVVSGKGDEGVFEGGCFGLLF